MVIMIIIISTMRTTTFLDVRLDGHDDDDEDDETAIAASIVVSQVARQ